MQLAFNQTEASSNLVRPTNREVSIKVMHRALNSNEAGSIPVPPTRSAAKRERTCVISMQGSLMARQRPLKPSYASSTLAPATSSRRQLRMILDNLTGPWGFALTRFVEDKSAPSVIDSREYREAAAGAGPGKAPLLRFCGGIGPGVSPGPIPQFS